MIVCAEVAASIFRSKRERELIFTILVVLITVEEDSQGGEHC